MLNKSCFFLLAGLIFSGSLWAGLPEIKLGNTVSEWINNLNWSALIPRNDPHVIPDKDHDPKAFSIYFHKSNTFRLNQDDAQLISTSDDYLLKRYVDESSTKSEYLCVEHDIALALEQATTKHYLLDGKSAGKCLENRGIDFYVQTKAQPSLSGVCYSLPSSSSSEMVKQWNRGLLASDPDGTRLYHVHAETHVAFSDAHKLDLQWWKTPTRQYTRMICRKGEAKWFRQPPL